MGEELFKNAIQRPRADGEVENGEAAAQEISLPEAFAQALAGNADLLGRGRSTGRVQHLGNLREGQDLLAKAFA
jgi:hypothetical protein